MLEKIVSITFIFIATIWTLVTLIGLMATAFKSKNKAKCPYLPLDGDSNSIPALGYK